MARTELNWKNLLFLVGYHVALIVCLPWYLVVRTPSAALLTVTIVVALLCGFSITAGYHRLYSHRTYSLNIILKTIILFFGTLSIQNSVLKWAHDHRLHHRYVDTDKDPYSIQRGFWYAHCLWIVGKPVPFDERVVTDLTKDRLVMFQHRHYYPLMVLTNAFVVVLTGRVLGDYFGAFTLVFLARLFFTHHTTFFINSLAHTWGTKPYSTEHSAVNNWIIALLTHGEGYHNFHHVFPSDYRNGVRWYQYDPTKFIIWTLHKLGFAWNLKRIDMAVINRKLLIEDRRILLQKIRTIGYIKLEEVEAKINAHAERMHARIADIQRMMQHLSELKKERTARRKEAIEQLRMQIKERRRAFRADLRTWGKLCDRILRLKPDIA